MNFQKISSISILAPKESQKLAHHLSKYKDALSINVEIPQLNLKSYEKNLEEKGNISIFQSLLWKKKTEQ